MIRLGSLAGYPFEGPRLLAGWTPPPAAAVLRDPVQAEPDTAGAVRGHLRRALPMTCPPSGSRSATRARLVLGAPGRRPLEGLHLHLRGARAVAGRTASRSAASSPRSTGPGCNEQQYDQAWKEEWIGGPGST